MNYEAERAMNQKRLRMEGEPGHGVVQGNGLPLNYMDNGHQIAYQPYGGAYNTHYPPPDAFAAYGPPPPGGYAPQNLSYAPPAHQNYPHHQSFPPQQPPQSQLHMAQSHMVAQGYGDVIHKSAWPGGQPHLLPPLLDPQRALEINKLKSEIKLEPSDIQKRNLPIENEMMGNDADQPKLKIKTDIFKPDDLAQHRPEDKPHEIQQKPVEAAPQTIDLQRKDDSQIQNDASLVEKSAETLEKEKSLSSADPTTPNATRTEPGTPGDNSLNDSERKLSTDSSVKSGPTTPFKLTPGTEPKKRGRPKGSTNKPKPPGSIPNKVLTPNTPNAMTPIRGGVTSTPRPQMVGRPRGTSYQYAIRPFRKDFSGIQFRRRWSDDGLDSSNIPNEVYFGDVPVPLHVLHNYYDANAERERMAAQAAQLAAQKAAAAKLAAAKLQARGILTNEVTTVDSSSSDDSSGSSGSGTDDSDDDDQPLKRKRGRPTGSKNRPKSESGTSPGTPSTGTGRRGRPPVPPELREPGITDMKKFCTAAGIRFDYKKLVEGCTKNKERVAKMLELLVAAGLEGKPTIEKCRAIKQAKISKKEEEKQAKKESKAKAAEVENKAEPGSRRMTRGATGVKPRQKIVISSDEEDDTPDARRTLSKLRSLVKDDSDSN